ncbi:MAG: glutaredoxin family protein [Zoogloeaceae bacterium]|nr:glutaredoxin family protein [Zoogloeaceae bacterium]
MRDFFAERRQIQLQERHQERLERKFILIGRGYCHLCDDMAEALTPLLFEYGAALEVLDVDADDTLLEKYDERVPVLLFGNREGVEICHYFLDEAKVRAVLTQIR